MGTEHDRARVRRRLAASAAPQAARGDDTADFEPAEAPFVDRGGRSRMPGWLEDPDDAAHGEDPEHGFRLWRGTRLNPGRRGAVALVVVGLVAAGIAAVSVWRDRPTAQAVPPLPAVEVGGPESAVSVVPSVPAPPSAQSVPPAPDAQVVVSVVGLVNQAGLVRLQPGARIADALAAAGGPKPGADLLGLNMAERVGDGDQILVGVAPPEGSPGTVGSARVGAGAPGQSAGVGSGTPVGKVNLNTATETELDALPGVGPVTAKAIVAWRQTHGRFTDIEQLGEVDGIGPARMAKLRELVAL
ncbi:ComEA family DNA-binding protein [Rhodococcus sp. ABRD24]|uniref:ComEA family DNA-binding protein n=1 Tax=Rhodococcus sp. ABRD24 TaxID=2507582 RepID=UPI001039F8D4|nr:ComEA family DNA-binding protein [Rhodococcus sp. ABRD24]QBJ95035.1 ComEA family DNA-binding protein [Rhodococcus sp. ABRD24]